MMSLMITQWGISLQIMIIMSDFFAQRITCWRRAARNIIYYLMSNIYNCFEIHLEKFIKQYSYLQVKVWFQNRRMKWRHSKEAQAQKDKEKEQSDKAETESEQKARDESECDTEQSDSDFEEEEQKRDANISDPSKHSLIIAGPVGTDIMPGTNTVTEASASSQIPF